MRFRAVTVAVFLQAVATWAFADTVRVHAILAPMSDGSDAPTVTPQQIRAALWQATEVFRPANIEFIFDPASDVMTIPSDLLSLDCTLAPGAVLIAPKSMPPACDPAPHDAERNRIAQTFPGKLVVYFAYGRAPVFDEAAGRWVMAGGLNWSNHVDSFVRFGPSDPGLTLAHEIGHYLHLVHTFPAFPDTYDISHLDDTAGKKGVRTAIREYVAATGVPKAQGLDVFDADRDICIGNPTIRCVSDTPPDPGPALFVNAGLDPCAPGDGTLSFLILWSFRTVVPYMFAPDRENIMNYWNQTCRGLPAHITPGQAAGVRDALEIRNRQHLVATKVLYSAVWEPGNRGTTRAIGWGFADIANRFAAEIASGQHLVHMQAYDLGGGQIRWDAVWEGGNRGTSWALGWGLSDFPQNFAQQVAAGNHLVHMQAYDLGGGVIRYDGVWEQGDRQTTFTVSRTMQDFMARFNQELALGRHLVHMQAYDAGGGQIRWDGVWESGNRGTSAVVGWGLQDFSGHFAQETAAGRHLVHLQAYDLGGGQIRYDGVWEAGNRGTSGVMGWGFNDFVWRHEQETAAGRILVHHQAYDVGGGAIRYDGIWENNPAGQTQTRILSESMIPFAARFNQETGQGRHVVAMHTVVGR